MEESLQKCNQVLFICTPRYKDKANERNGGVGYETNVITGDIYQNHNDIKYIPVLFDGDWNTAMPTWAIGKLGVDLRKESGISEFFKLFDALDSQNNITEISVKENVPEISQLKEKPPGPEEYKVLKQIYDELLRLKSWLVGLKTETDGSMKDQNDSEDIIREKVRNLQNKKNTYDFILNENVLKQLNELFIYWRNFNHIYSHIEEELTKEKQKAKNKSKMQRFMSTLFGSSVSQDMRNSYLNLKNACDTILSTIELRIRLDDTSSS